MDCRGGRCPGAERRARAEGPRRSAGCAAPLIKGVSACACHRGGQGEGGPRGWGGADI